MPHEGIGHGHKPGGQSEGEQSTGKRDLVITDRVRSGKHARRLGTATGRVGWGQQPLGSKGGTQKDRGLIASQTVHVGSKFKRSRGVTGVHRGGWGHTP